MASLKDTMKEALKHRNVSRYSKGRMADEIEKEKERKRRERTLGSRGTDSAGRDAWAALSDY